MQFFHHFRLGADHQSVKGLIRLDRDPAFAIGGTRSRGATFITTLANRRGTGGEVLQQFRHFFRITMAEPDHLHAAGGAGGAVQLLDQRHQAGAGAAVALDNQTVGALIGDHGGAALGAPAPVVSGRVRGGQFFQQRHHIAGERVLQLNDFNLVAFSVVEAVDNGAHALNVVGMVADNQRVGGSHRRQVTVLRHQRAQHRHQFLNRRVVHRDHLGDQLFTVHAARVGGQRQVALLGGGVGDDLDHATGRHCGVTVDLKHRQEQLIDFVGGQWLVGNDSHVTGAHPRIDDKVLPGHFRDLVDERLNVRVADIHRPVLAIAGLLHLSLLLGMGAESQAQR